jgi:predicted dienelactone hydrolase
MRSAPVPHRTRASKVGMVATLATAVLLLVSSCGRGDDPVTAAPTQQSSRGTAPPPTTGVAATGTTRGTTVATPAPTSSTAAPTALAPTSTASAPPTQAAPPTPGSPHAVGSTSVHLVDTSRPTVSRGRTIAESRSLPTTVYYPTDGGGPFPLIVFAHGFQIGPGPYAHLCQVLAAAGYVVAAPSFPLTDQNAAGANLDRGDLPNQAGDVSFVITSLTYATPPALAGKVDGQRIGIVGHSDGADTALDVGYFPFRNDPRVKAVAAFSPDAMTGAGGSVGNGVPLLLEHGDRDTIVPFSNSQSVFNQVHSHRFFLVMHGADHLPPVQGVAPWAPVLEQTAVAFLDRYVAGRTSTDAAITGAGSAGATATITTVG